MCPSMGMSMCMSMCMGMGIIYIYMCVCVLVLGFHNADQLPAAWGLWKRLFRFQSSMLSVAEAETSVEKEENGIGNPPKKIKVKNKSL